MTRRFVFTVAWCAALLLGVWWMMRGGVGTLGGQLGRIAGNRGDVLQPILSVEQQVQAAEAVMEVTVVESGDLRFNTDDGARPTEDQNVNPGGFVIYRPVVLRIDKTYKSSANLTGVDHIVVHRRGGALGNFQHDDVAGSTSSLDMVGEQGIVFLGSYTDEMWVGQNLPSWLKHIHQLAAERGGSYRAMGVFDSYLYDGTDAVYSLTGERLPIQAVVAEIQRAVGK